MGKCFHSYYLFFQLIFSSDATTNLRLAGQLGLRKRFQECLKDAEKVNHGYVVLNNSSKNRHDELRVSFNIFGEFKRFGPFPIFYVDD